MVTAPQRPKEHKPPNPAERMVPWTGKPGGLPKFTQEQLKGMRLFYPQKQGQLSHSPLGALENENSKDTPDDSALAGNRETIPEKPEGEEDDEDNEDNFCGLYAQNQPNCSDSLRNYYSRRVGLGIYRSCPRGGG